MADMNFNELTETLVNLSIRYKIFGGIDPLVEIEGVRYKFRPVCFQGEVFNWIPAGTNTPIKGEDIIKRHDWHDYDLADEQDDAQDDRWALVDVINHVDEAMGLTEY